MSARQGLNVPGQARVVDAASWAEARSAGIGRFGLSVGLSPSALKDGIRLRRVLFPHYPENDIGTLSTRDQLRLNCSNTPSSIESCL